jgi:macrolide transport system ATP-binding/permease protein
MNIRALVAALGRALLPNRRDREVDDEIHFHLSEEARLEAARGLTAHEAACAARRSFGSVALAKEATRAVWISTTVEQLVQDLRFGSRILTKSPAVSATAVVLIALVIGGNTTVFSIAHAILDKPMPGVRAAGLTTVSWVAEDGFIQAHNQYRAYSYFRDHSATLRPLAAFDFQRATLSHANGSYAVSAGLISPNYFETLGVRLDKGRAFTTDEAERGASGLVVVLSHQLWKTSFEGADDVVGREVTVNGYPAMIVGVAEPDFQGTGLGGQVDMWMPLAGEIRSELQPDRSSVVVLMIGRLAPGVSRTEAHAELTGLWSRLQQVDPELRRPALFANREHPGLKPRLSRYSATAGGDSLTSIYGDRMLAIFSVVTLLTIAVVCANVANLLIARAAVRQRELALRQSLGASRLRILRGLLAEGLSLSAVAWIAACVFAWWVSRAAITLVLSEAPATFVMPDITPDWTVLGYALVLALIATIAVTVAPAWRIRRLEILPSLKVGEQSIVQARSTLSRVLVVVQLAFSVLLLTSAGLAHRSLSLSNRFDIGFESRDLLLARINTAGSASSPEANHSLLQTLAGRIATLPGVERTSYVPGQTLLTPWVNFPVQRDRSTGVILATNHRVSAGFFHTLGVPFVAGGDFPETRHPGSQSVILTQALAEALWPGESPIGKTMLAGPLDRGVEVEVIGVVRSAHFSGRVTEAPPRYIFFANADRPASPGTATIYIRFSGAPTTIGPAVARALREADARVALAGLRSFNSHVAENAAPLRMLVTLLTLFAVGSLLIAAIGQYAVVAFDGRRRTREFAVRIALGASPPHLVASVLGETFKLTAVGLVVGFALSLAVAAVLSRFLFGVTATDPPTYAGVFAILTAASLAACYVPARRAARIDPMTALRTE